MHFRKLRTSVSQGGASHELLVALLCHSELSMGCAWAGASAACWGSAGALELPPPKKPPMAWPMEEPTATPLYHFLVSFFLSFFRL